MPSTCRITRVAEVQSAAANERSDGRADARSRRCDQGGARALPPSIVGAVPIEGAANIALGIEVSETTPNAARLPEMMTELENALGLPAVSPAGCCCRRMAAAAAAAAAAPAAAAPAAEASNTTSKAAKKAASSAEGSSSASRQRRPTFLPPQSANTQQKVTETKGLAKFLIRNAQLKQIAARQHEGVAIPFEDVRKTMARHTIRRRTPTRAGGFRLAPHTSSHPAQPLRDDPTPLGRLRDWCRGVNVALLMVGRNCI